jgi:dihydrofolate reductase
MRRAKGNQVRTLIYAMNFTLDGFLDHTHMVPDEALFEDSTQLLRDADTAVYGRKTYQLMVPYWPDIAKKQNETKAENEFALIFDSLHKVVFSKSLAIAEANSTIVRANLQDEILKLKKQPGKNILTCGADIPSQLIALGLVDEFRFVVHPVIAGQGRRLFEGAPLHEKLKLKLVESKTTKSGSVALRYVKA